MFGPIGFPELLLIFAVILLVFGPSKLPEFAKNLGKFVREFKSTVDDARHTIEREIDQADISKDFRELDRNLRQDLAVESPITPAKPSDQEPPPDPYKELEAPTEPTPPDDSHGQEIR